MRALIAEHFPSKVCISKPQGGSVLWVRCQSHVNTSDFFQEALELGVSFAPGIIFSPSAKYANFMRISFGVQWNTQVENAVKALGKLVFEYTYKQLQ
jgi:DNA-binding transcriptional MocR family regulator